MVVLLAFFGEKMVKEKKKYRIVTYRVREEVKTDTSKLLSPTELTYYSKKDRSKNKRNLTEISKRNQAFKIYSDKPVSYKTRKDRKGNLIFERKRALISDKTRKVTGYEGKRKFIQMRIDIQFTKVSGRRSRVFRTIGKSNYHTLYDRSRMFKEAFNQAYAQCEFSPDSWRLFGIYHRYKLL